MAADFRRKLGNKIKKMFAMFNSNAGKVSWKAYKDYAWLKFNWLINLIPSKRRDLDKNIEPVFLNVNEAQESIPWNEFRQPM